jgi:hypothetical protein
MKYIKSDITYLYKTSPAVEAFVTVVFVRAKTGNQQKSRMRTINPLVYLLGAMFDEGGKIVNIGLRN